METEAQTPALARLERAIQMLETAVSDRRRSEAAAGTAASDASTRHDDLAQRHEALKSAVAATLGDIDVLIAAGDRTDA